MITVTVTGPRGSGRTTAMEHIINHLVVGLGYKASNPKADASGNEYVNFEWSFTETTKDKTPQTKPLTALEEATKVIYGDREQTYGDPGKNLRVIAEYWTTHLRASNSIKTPLTADDVWVMMSLLKAARLANSPKHRDSIVDMIGYAALGDRINIAEEATEKAAIG